MAPFPFVLLVLYFLKVIHSSSSSVTNNNNNNNRQQLLGDVFKKKTTFFITSIIVNSTNKKKKVIKKMTNVLPSITKLDVALPLTMRAVQGKDYGTIDTMITVEDDVLVPKLDDLPEKQRKNHMIIKTLAVALAPGDCRVLSGKTKAMQGPPSFPYVPGGDCCGIVVEIPSSLEQEEIQKLPFQLGDIVGCGFMDGKPLGAAGEYSIVNIKNSDIVPDGITAEEAAALVGQSPAVVLSESYIQKGDRVLIFGAGGGMGSLVCQLAKNVHNASYIVGVTSQPHDNEILKLVCDEIIDYTVSDVFTNEKYITNPFDLIIDFAGGAYQRLEQMNSYNRPSIIKPHIQGGRFVTTVMLSGPTIEFTSFIELIWKYALPLLGKAISSRTWYKKSLPAFSFGQGLTFDRPAITKTFTLAHDKKIQAVIDPRGPFPFTTDGVRRAFHLQESHHPRGKVIISIQQQQQKQQESQN